MAKRKRSAGPPAHVLRPRVPQAASVQAAETFRAESLMEARQALAASDFSRAEALARKTLAAGPDAGGELLLARAVLGLGRAVEAHVCFARALALSKKGDALWLEAAAERARLHMRMGQNKEAVELYAEVVARAPDVADHRRLYGVTLRRLNRLAEAETQLRRGYELAPDAPDVVTDLAWFLEEVGRGAEGRAIAVKAIESVGCEATLVRLRAVLERRQGLHKELIGWLQAELRDKRDNLALWRELAHTVAHLDGARSVPIFREVVRLAPNDFDAIVELANRLQRTRGPDEAKFIEEAYQLSKRALDLKAPTRPKWKELHEILTRVSDFDRIDSLGSFSQLCLEWANKNLAAGLHGMLGQARTPEDRILLVDCHRRCGDQSEAHADLAPLPPRPAVVSRAKVRIGFMSSDLRNHPVSYFALPLLENMDRSKFEIYCYSWATTPVDAVQQRIMERVDAFRQDPVIGNRGAAEMIANDDLDILFELGGSTHMNKLDVMAWRPAPRQASWLGYPASAGIGRIDRLLVDPYTRPSYVNLMIEKPFQLERSWVCLESPGFGPLPPIAEKSAYERRGFVTFGTANNPYKYNRDLLRTWAAVLRAVPNSRFLFVRPEGGAPSFRANLSKFFESEGVDPKRLAFVPVRGDHLRFYNEMDISLDTFPQTGGTTTCETLFMGVPVVTLAGAAIWERLSYSNLVNADLSHLVAYSRETFVEIAVRLAQNHEWRRKFRLEARQMIARNPLGQPSLFARDFERAALAWMDEKD